MVEFGACLVGVSQADERRPFGVGRSSTGIVSGWPSESVFLNKTGDSTTGLTHVDAREYDSLNGRFLTPDPLVQQDRPQSTAYAYSGNNDRLQRPTGLRECAGGCMGNDTRCARAGTSIARLVTLLRTRAPERDSSGGGA